jgi:hypothetical protein
MWIPYVKETMMMIIIQHIYALPQSLEVYILLGFKAPHANNLRKVTTNIVMSVCPSA